MAGTFVDRDLFRSKAFFSLTGVAPQVLINFLGKRKFSKHKIKKQKKYICGNSDSIQFTYIEARELGITQPRFTRAIDDLLAKGFISVAHPGGMGEKDKATYSIVDKWIMWRKELVFETRKRESVQRGFCKYKKET